MKLDHDVKHLLVDLDGTLLGNRNVSLSFQFVREALGLLKPLGGWRKSVGALLSINQEFKHPSTDATNDQRVVQSFARKMDISLEQSRLVLRDSIAKIFPGLERHFYPIPGAKEFLDWAKGRYPMTLATNPVWPPEVIELRVKWAGIDPSIFQSMTHIHEMTACKPSTDYYERLLANRQLKAEDCLLIGNDMKMDLPATVLGIPVFIVGPFKELTRLKYPKAKAQGLRGSYHDLRALLEASGA